MNVAGLDIKRRTKLLVSHEEPVKTYRQVSKVIEKDGMFVPVVENVPFDDTRDIRDIMSWSDWSIGCIIANGDVSSLKECKPLVSDVFDTLDKIGDTLDAVENLKETLNMSNEQDSNEQNSNE